jgi:hypothetical protein
MKNAYWLLQIATLLSICAFQLNADYISGNVGIRSAAVILSGAANLAVTADSAGNYSFNTLGPGNYVVTPSLSGYAFNPASQTVIIASASVNSVSFTASAINSGPRGGQPATPAPSGPAPGAPAPSAPSPSGPAPGAPAPLTDLAVSPTSVEVTGPVAAKQVTVQAGYLSGASTDVTTNATYASNNTSVAQVSQGGLITPVGTGNAIIVASYGGLSSTVTVTVSIPPATATYSISGSAGVASAAVAISGASNASTTSSSIGAFSFPSLPSGNYILTPSLTGYTFTPSSQSATITNANVSGVNFTATATPHSVELSWGAGTIQNPVSGQFVVGYNVYRSSVSGGPYTQLNLVPTPAFMYMDNAVSAGETLYYVCSTVDSLGNVSRYSNQATVTVP